MYAWQPRNGPVSQSLIKKVGASNERGQDCRVRADNRWVFLGLVYGSFSYTKDTHEAKLGTLELSVKSKQTVDVPVWAGVGAIVLGGLVLALGGKKKFHRAVVPRGR